MKKTNLILLAGFSTGFLSLSSQAQVLFNDDFESYTVDTSPGTAGDIAFLRGPERVRDENTTTAFGSTNQFVELSDTATGNFTAMMMDAQSGANNALTTYSFDFYEPTIDLQTDSIQVGYSLSADTGSLSSSDSRARISLDDGTIGGLTTSVTYALDTAYKLSIILNDTDSAVSYSNGTLAANSFDVYLQILGSSTSTFVGNALATNTKGDYSVGFRSFNTALQTLYVDNVSLETGAVVAPIPEPATMALLLGSLGLLALRRRA